MKKLLVLALVVVLALSTAVFASDFKDMPNDWSTSALEAAVKNGLLTGNGGYIKASDNMTRAEMATIMVRATGATGEVDLSSFVDVTPDDWFYTSMSRAVAMGAFSGADNRLNPNSPITRQEAFLVLSRVFALDRQDGGVDVSVLDTFKDSASIADWAKNGVAAIVSKGYVAGNDGYINPLNNISRAEFAVVMDRLVKYYIDDADAQIPTDGNVMIRTAIPAIKDLNTDKMVILGDAIGKESVVLQGANISDRLVVRTNGYVNIDGKYNSVIIATPGAVVESLTHDVDYVYIAKDSKYVSPLLLPTVNQ